ncbi:hypothetical protein F4Z98_05900 [Candidatus Poribacteria bacterium]|nr:hypothetical protein [Candidatus Poribacteria bacterium]MYB01788.1 hypothetical protein [Candidatus Poribacteria bacterium]MYI34839.1 hypothetical protein [Acidimicrobiaceae bacterium]
MEQEILTPTEKLKALRQEVKTLSDTLGKVVTYDDDTTESLLQAAEGHAVTILQIIHDGNSEDIAHAVFPQLKETLTALYGHLMHIQDTLTGREIASDDTLETNTELLNRRLF